MKSLKYLSVLFLVAIAGCGRSPQVPVGPYFSVSDSTWVEFAPGNLTPDGQGFEPSQLHYGGLFGWGTGNNSGNTSENHLDYPSFHDWGESLGHGWRTMSVEEWRYLLFLRPRADSLRATGMVGEAKGLLLLPDNVSLPADLAFAPGTHGWSANRYTLAQWQRLEQMGAVFLATPGFRWGTDVYAEGCEGMYWTSSSDDEYDAHVVYFSGDTLNTTGDDHRFFGNSVRLARNLSPSSAR